MQFVANGPDIPETLLQMHEEGRVVFFCGAGISYPANLPDFEGLVTKIYHLVGTTPTEIERETFKRSQFDATLNILEHRLPGGRKGLEVRRALVEALKPNLRRKGAKDTHKALLQLGLGREGSMRLVTTNFDRIFAKLTARMRPSVPAYAAPLLPIPKNSRWNGLVYLHGLLPKGDDVDALSRLVLTSGDFGLAYLTERWAARFVSELFRNYLVCFVGYSINDPVLRYMMDALAADRILGEETLQPYALGDYKSGQEHRKRVEWQAKGVVPILYEVPAGSKDHSVLHSTLKAWAETYRDGVLGKERIVVEYAMAHPSASSQQDDFVGRMLWALADKSGLPAKRFADLDPAPPLGWLEALSENRYRYSDLARFGVSSLAEVDNELSFSLVRRPAPYSSAQWMMLVTGGAITSRLDRAMFELARWMVRHLDDPALILWLAQRGGQLHDQFSGLIEIRIRELDKLEREGKTDELARIRAQDPNAIPRQPLRALWRLLLAGRVKSPGRGPDLYRWISWLNSEGLTATLRFGLREVLAPKVELAEPFRLPAEATEPDTPERLADLVSWRLVLADANVRAVLGNIAETEHWRDALPVLFDDFQQLLRDALDLSLELSGNDDRSDPSLWHLPSITPHFQNRGLASWVALIELVRDAWLAIREDSPHRSTEIAQVWSTLPYATFKRLALFAASHDGCIDADQWVDWLVADDARWLWSTGTKRETLRLLVLQGQHLTTQTRDRLETAILAGPPHARYRADIELDRRQELENHSVWLYLAKLKASGGGLGDAAAERLRTLSDGNPALQLAQNESDEFFSWMSVTGDPGSEEDRDIDLAPRKRKELVAWLKRPLPSNHASYEDNWPETCRSRFFHCALALCDLARDDHWPAGRWVEALQAWSEDQQVRRSWRFIAPQVLEMPEKVFKDIVHGIAHWMKTASKPMDRHEDIFLALFGRIVALAHEDEVDSNHPVSRAINHPVGHVTEGLLNLWFKRKPNDNDQLPSELEPFFTQLCDAHMAQYRHGRVLLASRLIALFRVDRRWTETNLLPLFDWEVDAREARAAWEGFLWSPRLYPPLLAAIKKQFLDTARHYSELSEHGQQFSAFLTYAALDPVDPYTVTDFQAALAALPQEGLNESARALAQALEGAGEQREDYWTNRIWPFWQGIWPKSVNLVSQSITESLARLSIAAGEQFPTALTTVVGWLQPLEHPYSYIHLLHKSGLPSRFPEHALSLLDKTLRDQPWVPEELNECLTAISQAEPSLAKDSRFRRLEEYSRRHGA